MPIPKKRIAAALIEAGFIVFLFYANLLMGEFERTGGARRHSFAWAVEDVFTFTNFAIAIVAAIVGYFFFEFLRKRL